MFKKIICFCLTLILFAAFCLNAFAYVEYDYYDIESIITNHLPMYADTVINNYILYNFSADYPYVIIKANSFENHTYFKSFPPEGYGTTFSTYYFTNDDYYLIYNDSITDSDGNYKPILFTYDGKITNWSKISSFGFVVDDTDESQSEFKLKVNNYRFFEYDDNCYNMYIDRYDICIIHNATYTNSSDTMIFSNTSSNSYNIDSDVYYGETDIETLTETDSESEYHGGVLGWFQQIYNNISGGFTNIGNSISSFVSSVGGWFSDTWDYITDIPNQIIEGLEDLFIPTVNPFTSAYNIVITYFPFVEQVRQLALQLVSSEFYGNDIPTFTVDFSHFGGGSVEIVDLSFYQPYRAIVHGIIIALSYSVFIMHLVKRLPTILTGNVGVGGGSS